MAHLPFIQRDEDRQKVLKSALVIPDQQPSLTFSELLTVLDTMWSMGSAYGVMIALSEKPDGTATLALLDLMESIRYASQHTLPLEEGGCPILI